MRIVELLESENSTRWLLSIDGKPAAHYPSAAEATKIKRQLTLKFGMKHTIEIKEVPAKQFKFKQSDA